MVALAGCTDSSGGAYARVVTSTSDLVGGPAATGEFGDVVLGNDFIRVIISRRRPARGIAPVTGAIIDAAPLRAGATGQRGADALDVVLPLLMTAGFDAPAEGSVTVESDGTDGSPAVVRVRAEPVSLLRVLEVLDADVVPFAGIRLETDYILEPDARHVVVRSTLINGTGAALSLDGSVLRRQLDAVGVSGPQPSLLLGDALVTGRRSRLFVPTAVPDENGSRAVGYDISAGDAAARALAPPLPALPGMLADFVASTADGVSYGWAVAPNRNNAVRAERNLYATAGLAVPPDPAMVVTLAVPGGLSVHHTVTPDVLEAGESFEVERYFIVGTGDVASLRDELARIRGTPTGVLSGEIRSDPGGVPIGGAELHVLDGDFRPFSVVNTDGAGRFRAVLPEGGYFLRAVATGAPPTETSASLQSGVEIVAGQSVYRRIALTTPAGVSVRALDASGRPVPAKVSVVGTYDPTTREAPAELLVSDLSLERRRVTDGSERRPIGQRANEYVEAVGWGLGTIPVSVRPNDCAEVPSCSLGARTGSYRIVVSRGPEFEVAEIGDVMLVPGQNQSFSVQLDRSVDTQGYLAVDFDIKSVASPGGVWAPAERALAAAGEGVEAYFAGDANRVTAAFVEAGQADVQDWIRGFDGVELSTLEQGEHLVLPVLWNNGRENGLPDERGCIVGAGTDTRG
ncbi:MAG: carboxypeptidase-like regulatory domain-containing protein, partial [Myxococcota bacterium]